jgi:hypothetical protein
MDAEKREVLSLLTEDLYNPHEIALWVPVGRRELARILDQLLREGLAEWYIRDNDSAPAVPLSELQVPIPDLADDETWIVTDLRSRQLLLGATRKGETEYYGE